MRQLKPLFALLLLSSVQIASAGNLSIAGVWKGTVGKQAVMVCFTPSNVDSQYYYVDHLIGIHLTPVNVEGNSDMNWSEGSEEQVTGYWLIDHASKSHVQGQWQDKDRTSSLPIELTLVKAGNEQSGDCQYALLTDGTESLVTAFNEPRIAAASTTIDEALFEDKHYQKITTVVGQDAGSTATSTSLILPDSVPNAPVINRFARQWLAAQVAEIYSQLQANEKGETVFIGGGAELTPLFWTGHWLVVEEASSEGMHGRYFSHHTYDLETGKPVEVYTSWFKSGVLDIEQREENQQDVKPLDNLATIVINEYKKARIASYPPGSADAANDECISGDVSPGFSDTYPGKEGMVFALSFCGYCRPCEDNVIIPYEQLLPYATDAGNKAIKSLMAETQADH